MSNFDGKIDGVLTSHIPAFEISFADAKHMVNVIHDGTDVVYMKATFDVTKADNSVEVDLWYSTSLDLGTNLSTELAAMSVSFTADHAQKPLFTPRIASFDCLTCAAEFKEENCMAEGLYCGFQPAFYKEYELEERGVVMSGRDILMQALREKCLHKIMTEKYRDEGDIFFTFFSYLRQCFEETSDFNSEERPKSLNDCFDWSTVQINGEEEVDFMNSCVEGSFTVAGDLNTDHPMLREDREWALVNHMRLHPAVTINNISHTNSTGHDLALAICSAYREAPDECELSWRVPSFEHDADFEGLNTPMFSDEIVSASKQSHSKSEGEYIFGSWHVYLLTAIVILLNVGVLLFVRYRMKS